jgi:hypothetical protein
MGKEKRDGIRVSARTHAAHPVLVGEVGRARRDVEAASRREPVELAPSAVAAAAAAAAGAAAASSAAPA